MKKILFAMFMALTFVMNAKANVSDVGTIKSNKMNFTLYVVGKYLGASFPARVSFEGTKK